MKVYLNRLFVSYLLLNTSKDFNEIWLDISLYNEENYGL